MQTSQLGLNTLATIKDIAELLTVSRKDPLPEWKLDTYDGNPLNWHEWYGQLRSAVESTRMSQDVKLKNLKNLGIWESESSHRKLRIMRRYVH